MRILCVSAPMPGHLDWGGYLPTAVALQRRGHEILWASGAAVQPLLARAGVPQHVLQETGWRWPPPPPIQRRAGMDPHAMQRLRAERGLDQWLDVGRVRAAVVELQAVVEAFAPDCLVSEAFVSAAALVAEMADVPFVVAGWPGIQWSVSGPSQPVVALARQRLQTLCDAFHVSGINWTDSGPPALLSPHLHITYWSPSWYGDMALLPQTHHVGGTIEDDAPAKTDAVGLPAGRIAQRPLVLVTLGTSFADDPNFFVAAARAIDQSGAQPLLVLGGFCPAEGVAEFRRGLPETTLVTPHVDFAEVLPQVAAAVHHGGAGTTHALVVHGVPQIIVPHAADQMHQAHGVVRSGVGVFMPPREVTVARLAEALRALLPAAATARQRASELRREFAALGGISAAADLLEAV